MAKSFGADVLINPLKVDPVSAIRDVTRGGEGADKAMECSSNPDARRQSVESLRPWGTTCLVGVSGNIEFNVAEAIHKMRDRHDHLLQVDHERLRAIRGRAGARCRSAFFDQFQLDDAKRAYQLFDTQKIGKGVFVFD